MIDPDAKPIAHHTPAPVPLHWQEDVKAGLYYSVSLGVLEPVPVRQPVTRCHWMVVYVKKNGKPHRTVDFQALNRHATRETHHTQSPFHQAQLVPHNTKKTIFTAGTDIRVFHYTRMTITSPLSSPHGAIPLQNSITGLHCFRGWLFENT